MEWVDKLNEAINYIEENLTSEVDFELAAQIACCSTYHFQRMFSYIAGVPLAEYIRKRRMTLAAFELQNSQEKIIDIALKYGYESPTAFNRAFQSVHHIPPIEARAEGTRLTAFPRISFKLTIKGAVEMEYRIVNKESFRVVGVKKSFPITGEEGFTQVPLFWQEIMQSGKIMEIAALGDGEPTGVLGVSTGMEQFDYYIAAASTKAVPEEMVEFEVPAATYAVFECIGMSNLQTLERAIVTEWLTTSGYEYAGGVDFERYPEGNTLDPNYVCEVWYSVKKCK